MIGRFVVGLASLVGTASISSAEIMWGVNGHPITAYPGIEIEEQLELISDLGMKSYRINVSFADSAPHLADIVREAKARGIEILPVVTPGGLDLDNESPQRLYDKAYDLAFVLGSAIGDEVRVWELGNEMENYAIIQPCEMRDDGSQYPCDWGPAGGVHALDYFGPRWEKVSAVLRGLSDGITAVDPKIRKAIGTAGWGHVGAFERMEEDGVEWDVSVWHMYGQDPEGAFKDLQQYGRPIWITEFNNPRGSEEGAQQQADGLALSMNRLEDLADSYGVEAAHIYELLDEPYWGTGYEAVMGLVTLEPTTEGGWTVGQPKPAYFAAKEIIRAHPQRDCDLTEIEQRDPIAARQAAYVHCLLFGAVDSDAVSNWATALDSGAASASELLAAVLRSDSFRERFSTESLTDQEYVAFLFRLLLDREADPYGLDSYAAQISKGSMTRVDVALGTASSDEFEAKHPVLFSATASVAKPAEEMIEVRFKEAEAPPPGERSCDLEGMGTIRSLSARQANYVHCLMLGSAPEPRDVKHWSAELESGDTDLDGLLTAMLRSDEFRGRYSTESLSDRSYVGFLYRLLLGREADPHGLDTYAAQLGSGSMSREAVALSTADSDEFRSRHDALFE